MTMMNELSAAKRFLSDLNRGEQPVSVLCAVSGGLDSMCLLHLLSTWGREQGMSVTAAHFNHQLRGAESDRDEAFVRDRCAANNVPFVSGSADVRALAAEKGFSIEEAAREARYAFLEEQRQKKDRMVVLTAHHADDNAETMLLNLLRGTGGRGLTGIPPFRGKIARPFLAVTRAELAAYAEEHHIAYVEDSSNALDDAARNVLRHKVLPVLRELNPAAVENMARTARLLARDEAALGHLAEDLMSACHLEPERVTINIKPCIDAELAILSRCVWAMMTYVCGHQKDLTARHVEAVCDLVRGPSGREVALPYGMTARREEDSLVIFRKTPLWDAVNLCVGETVLFGSWKVTLSATSGGTGLLLPEDAVLQITQWRSDDRMTLPGSRGSRSVKRLCIDRGISPTERDMLPVLRVNGQAAAIPGIGIHKDYLPDSEKEPVYVIFQKETEEKNHEK